VNSPTFVLIQEYAGPVPVYHFDTYRLSGPREFAELGVEEYLAGDGVCVVEWADKVSDVLPVDHLRVTITPTGPTARRFELTATGPRHNRLLAELVSTSPQPGGAPTE
jgi:tRNA threonylcarbamoyladenosine biosynthesis protein TsaE